VVEQPPMASADANSAPIANTLIVRPTGIGPENSSSQALMVWALQRKKRQRPDSTTSVQTIVARND
jgi:hypothetical protein